MEKILYCKKIAKLYYEKGNNESDMKQYLKSIEFYNKSLKINPKSGFCLNNKGIALFNLNLIEQSIVCYNQALDINRYDALAYYNKGISLHELKRYDEACECYTKSLFINPNFKSALFNKGYSLFQLNKLNEALDCFLNSNKNDLDILNSIGIVLNALDRHQEAVQYFNKAIEINSNFELAKLNLNLTLDRLYYN